MLWILVLVVGVWGDCYLHNPRGSNNRLNAETVNAINQKRLFDSQNNAKGGYNVGVGESASGQPDDAAGALVYYTGTTVRVEWTNQHACGDLKRVPRDHEDYPMYQAKVRECEIVIQYMCKDSKSYDGPWDTSYLRNGFNEDTPSLNGRSLLSGQHEPLQFYESCKTRSRNKGLFTADRRLRGEAAIYTRQNNEGTRHGFECPEERDYYPYWHPTPWRDAAILTNNPARCDYYRRESQNVRKKGHCGTTGKANNPQDCKQVQELSEDEQRMEDWKEKITNKIGWLVVMAEKKRAGQLDNLDHTFDDVFKKPGGPVDTLAADPTEGLAAIDAVLRGYSIGKKGQWIEEDSWGLAPPECLYTNWTRSNHLGNGEGNEPIGYNWTIPDSIVKSGKENNCVLRVRYNMSSADYDNWKTHQWGNYDPAVIENSPKIEDPAKLQLTLNTNQVSRTFQDRSHIFKVAPRPTEIVYPKGMGDSVKVSSRATIHNVNVRGKRGNIVQAYPAVEYDFMPNKLVVEEGDFVHFQWTGSNTNPRNYAGQGTRGTDRHNIMQTSQEADNIPLPASQVTMWGADRDVSYKRYVHFALLGQTDPLLNKAPAYFNTPPIQFKTGNRTYHYTCTRNNNFSNRSQKGSIHVKKKN